MHLALTIWATRHTAVIRTPNLEPNLLTRTCPIQALVGAPIVGELRCAKTWLNQPVDPEHCKAVRQSDLLARWTAELVAPLRKSSCVRRSYSSEKCVKQANLFHLLVKSIKLKAALKGRERQRKAAKVSRRLLNYEMLCWMLCGDRK